MKKKKKSYSRFIDRHKYGKERKEIGDREKERENVV